MNNLDLQLWKSFFLIKLHTVNNYWYGIILKELKVNSFTWTRVWLLGCLQQLSCGIKTIKENTIIGIDSKNKKDYHYLIIIDKELLFNLYFNFLISHLQCNFEAIGMNVVKVLKQRKMLKCFILTNIVRKAYHLLT